MSYDGETVVLGSGKFVVVQTQVLVWMAIKNKLVGRM